MSAKSGIPQAATPSLVLLHGVFRLPHSDQQSVGLVVHERLHSSKNQKEQEICFIR